jgi:seryl-tRNA synthetase
MINKKLLIDDFENTVRKIGYKGVNRGFLEEARDIILERGKVQKTLDDKREQINNINNEIKTRITEGKSIDDLKEQIRILKEEIPSLEEKYQELETKESKYLYEIPNLPDDSCPVGNSEEDNVVLEYVNYDENNYKNKTFLPHWELGEKLDIFDSKTATKLSGAMFSLLKKDGARMIRALVNLALDLNREKYTEILAPHFVTTKTITGTGHLPKFKDDQYKIENEDLWANPTAEVPLTGMHAGDVFEEIELPKRYMAYCVSFRREAGSAGKDTRGMQRLHEFHKVEMMGLCKPEQVMDEFNAMVKDARRIIDLLKLPYRVLELCTGDVGDKYAKCYDLEVYAPGVDKWLEVSSIGFFTDYQSRRCNIKYKKEDGSKELVYTYNGSGMATPRVWAAILENYQNEDGSITIPEVLRPYMGGKEKIEITK